MTFSIIMPVYGVEKYLATAIECVLAQSFMDFELILVDDCSPDACPQICDAYAAKDPRIKVIHNPENKGLGLTRNIGLEQAQGKYVVFMDSDDFVSREMLKRAYAAAADNDIVVFGFVSQYENKRGVTTWAEAVAPPAIQTASSDEIGEAFVQLSHARVFQYAWNKIYRRDFLLSIGVTFTTTPLIEDFLFNIAAFDKANKVCAIPHTLYFYRHPPHDTLATRYSSSFFGLSKRKYLLEREFLENHQALTDQNEQFILEGYVKHLLSAFIRNRAKNSPLNLVKQFSKMRTALKDPLTKEVLSVYRPKGRMRPICYFFKNRDLISSYFVAVLGTWMQKLKTAAKRGL